MELKAAYRARMLAAPGLTGSAIVWGDPVQGTPLPYIRLTRAGGGRDWDHDGADPLVNPRVQADFYAASIGAASALADAFQAEMERIDDVIVGDWRFLAPGVLISDQMPGQEYLPGGVQAFRVIHDYRFLARPA